MRRFIICTSAVALLTLAAFSTKGADNKAKSKSAKTVAAVPSFGNADAINEQELKIYDYFLASDQLEGRNFPSRGYDTAALYVASHLAEWGLKPFGSTSGTNGPLQPYMMPIEMVSKQVVADESKATLTAPGGGGRGGFGGGGGGGQGGGRGRGNTEPVTTNYEYGKDWTLGGGGGFGGGGRGGAAVQPLDVSGNLVFAGNGYVIEKDKANPYEGLDVKGKIVVVAGLPAELAALRNRAPAGAADVAAEVEDAGAAAMPPNPREPTPRAPRPMRKPRAEDAPPPMRPIRWAKLARTI